MTKFKFAASIVCGDMLNLGRDLADIERGHCEYIHFDVMDGVFVPRFGLLPEMLSAIKRNTNIPVDVHLMVQDPERYVPTFIEAGADIITVHAEACVHLHRALLTIRRGGAKAGVALNHSTPVNVLEHITDDIDLVLLMAINPGIVGHKLIPAAISKIKAVKSFLDSRQCSALLEVDGGVTPESAAEMVSAGAELLVCGSSTIFRPNYSIADKCAELRCRIATDLEVKR